MGHYRGVEVAEDITKACTDLGDSSILPSSPSQQKTGTDPERKSGSAL
ncbi:MAG: hypothetical protein Q9N34_01755 [Aquificota bacterium]|nr:hypothetical protein [Aquificota bacterium]